MLTVHMLPAREGDCIVVAYGDPDRPRRILIDGGRKATYDDLKRHFADLPGDQRQLELLIVTHVDRDHIEGVISLLEDPDRPVSFKDVWFNGYHHLVDEDFESFGAVQGERLTGQLTGLARDHGWLWNGSFGNDYEKAAALPADGALPDVELDGGLRLTLLSPSRRKLTDLVPRWEKECEKAGIVAGVAATAPDPEGFESFGSIDIEELAEEPFEEDHSEPNGSSIAVLAQYGEHRILLSGDAHPGLLQESLARLSPTGPVELDAFKLPHHGSRGNVSKELLQAVRCSRYLFSTNGSYFDHPDPVAVSRVIRYGGPKTELWFNYLSDETRVWDVPSWKQDHDYSVHYPAAGANGFQTLTFG